MALFFLNTQFLPTVRFNQISVRNRPCSALNIIISFNTHNILNYFKKLILFVTLKYETVKRYLDSFDKRTGSEHLSTRTSQVRVPICPRLLSVLFSVGVRSQLFSRSSPHGAQPLKTVRVRKKASHLSKNVQNLS